MIDFKIPDGGISIWAKFDKSISLVELSEKVGKKGFIYQMAQLTKV